MKRLLLACGIVALAWTDAHALSPTCLSNPLPTTPLGPTFTLEVFFLLGDHVQLDIWRHPCTDGSGETAVLARATPVVAGSYLCSNLATILQNGNQLDAALRESTAGSTFCGQLFVAKTLVLTEDTGQPAFHENGAFTLIYSSTVLSQVEIPAAGPPPPPPLSVRVVITGCNPCRIGDFAELHLHIVNPGPARAVEVKAGSHFPDGETSFVFLGRYVEIEIPLGEINILIPGITLEAGLPFGTYTIEAALLDPDFGTTLSRDSVTATLVP